MQEQGIEFSQLGEGALLAKMALEPSPELARRLAAVAGAMRAYDGIHDAVPAYHSLAVYADPWETDWQAVQDRIAALWQELTVPAEHFTHHRIPVSYHGEDLEFLAEHAGLTVSAVIERHSTPIYTIAMIGFQRHFPYLLGLDKVLACPRRQQPRTRITPGAVAIGGEQTGIYSEMSPGGWHILGYTDPGYCQQMAAGDSIQFEVQG